MKMPLPVGSEILCGIHAPHRNQIAMEFRKDFLPQQSFAIHFFSLVRLHKASNRPAPDAPYHQALAHPESDRSPTPDEAVLSSPAGSSLPAVHSPALYLSRFFSSNISLRSLCIIINTCCFLSFSVL